MHGNQYMIMEVYYDDNCRLKAKLAKSIRSKKATTTTWEDQRG